jgi:hypothetical protein
MTMNSLKTTLILNCLIIISLILSSSVNQVLSCCGGSHHGSSTSSSGHVVPPPPFFHPPPPGFVQKWFIRDAVDSINKKGLLIDTVSETTEVDYRTLPAEAKEGIKFSLPPFMKDIKGCILSFENKEDLKKVQKHFLELNEKGYYHSWSFAKDNILMILGGSLSESQAKQFESALYDLEK